MIRGFAKAALAAAAAVALAGCIVVHEDSDDDWDDGEGWTESAAAGAYLMVPVDAIAEEGAHRVFFHDVVPALTLEHALTNAGTEDAPWFCFAYADAVDADYGRRFVAGLEGGEPLAARLIIDDVCAAG